MNLTALPATKPLQAEVYPWTNLARLAAWVILLFGAVLRVARFIHFRSLWLDELYLATSFSKRGYHDLLFKPLDYWQAAPAGFLFLTKFFTAVFGPGERALRLTALLFNLASLYFFYKIVRRTLSAGPGLVAVGLFSVLGPLIYYASELKQYSCDVAVTLAIMLATMRWIKNRDVERIAILAVVGAVGIFFSHPAVFVLAGAGAICLISLKIDQDSKNVGPLIGAFIIWLIAFAINFVFFVKPLATGSAHPHLVQYWADRDAFMPIAPWSALAWLFFRICFICQDPGAMWMAYPGLAMLAILVGIVDLARRRRQFFILLVAPIFFALVASMLRQYPFGDRLILFMVPTLIILMAAGIDALRRHSPCGVAGWIAMGMLVLPSLSRATGYLFHPPGREETLQAYQWIARHYEPGDTIYLSHYAVNSFDYYESEAGLPADAGTEAMIQPKYEDDPRGFVDDVKKLAGRKRVWVVLVHMINGHLQDEGVFTKMGLESIGVPVKALSHSEEGATALMYDCTVTPPPATVTP